MPRTATHVSKKTQSGMTLQELFLTKLKALYDVGNQLEQGEAADILEETLTEEQETSRELTELAESRIDERAMEGAEDASDEDEKEKKDEDDDEEEDEPDLAGLDKEEEEDDDEEEGGVG